MLRSPCLECEFIDKDKRNPTCEQCERRVRYLNQIGGAGQGLTDGVTMKTEKTKKCRDCGEKKVFSDFHNDSNSKDGISTICKVCKNKYIAERAKKKDKLKGFKKIMVLPQLNDIAIMSVRKDSIYFNKKCTETFKLYAVDGCDVMQHENEKNKIVFVPGKKTPDNMTLAPRKTGTGINSKMLVKKLNLQIGRFKVYNFNGMIMINTEEVF